MIPLITSPKEVALAWKAHHARWEEVSSELTSFQRVSLRREFGEGPDVRLQFTLRDVLPTVDSGGKHIVYGHWYDVFPGDATTVFILVGDLTETESRRRSWFAASPPPEKALIAVSIETRLQEGKLVAFRKGELVSITGILRQHSEEYVGGHPYAAYKITGGSIL